MLHSADPVGQGTQFASSLSQFGFEYVPEPETTTQRGHFTDSVVLRLRHILYVTSQGMDIRGYTVEALREMFVQCFVAVLGLGAVVGDPRPRSADRP
jgi:hypothetical protein